MEVTRRTQPKARSMLASLVGLWVVLVAVSACGPSGRVAEARPGPRPTVTTTSSTAPVGVAPTGALPSTTEIPAASVAPPVTAIPTDQDGRIFALIKGVDPVARTLTIDVAQYIGGDDHLRWLASDPERWTDLYCDSTHGYYDGTQDLLSCGSLGQNQTVVNDNPRLRTLSIADDATFAVATSGVGTPNPVDVAGFVRYVQSGMQMGNTFWITVRDGWIRDVQFQFFS